MDSELTRRRYTKRRREELPEGLLRFFSTISQQATQESFAGQWDDEAEKVADGDENTMRPGGKIDRSKTSRVPRY
jgi:hypothetical protein